MYQRKITALERETAHEYIRKVLMDRGLKYELSYNTMSNSTIIAINGKAEFEIVWNEVNNVYESMHEFAKHIEKEYDAPVESSYEFYTTGNWPNHNPVYLPHSVYGHLIGEAKRNRAIPPIDDVIFNNPATIVLWSDGTKTVVKAVDEAFDEEKGLAMAICKKIFGNKGNYFNEIKKWLPKIEEKE